jgi:serine protease Do
MRFRYFLLAGLMGSSVGMAQSQQVRATQVANVPMVTYLGVAFRDVDVERAKTLKLPEQGGVEITFLAPNSPASDAGMKAGDVVAQYNGQRVEDGEQFARLVRDTPAGREVKLQIYRNGVSQTLVAKLVLHPATMIQGQLVPLQPPPPGFRSILPDVPINRMSWESGALGAELESVEGQIADYFGVKEGVLVRSVMRGSAADRAGLKAGDVITRVGDAKIAAPVDVSGRIRAGRGQSVSLGLLRDHREMSVTVMLDGLRPGDQ